MIEDKTPDLPDRETDRDAYSEEVYRRALDRARREGAIRGARPNRNGGHSQR